MLRPGADVPLAPLNYITEHSPKLFTRNPVVRFLEVDKTYVEAFAILPRFLENWSVKIWSVVLRQRRKQHWVSSSFGTIISRLF